MFCQIVNAVRTEILKELENRVVKGTNYIFRSFNDVGGDEVYALINVGYPKSEETEYYPDVMRVYRNEKDKVMVVVQDETGLESEYAITDLFLDVNDLAAILDALIEGDVVEERE